MASYTPFWYLGLFLFFFLDPATVSSACDVAQSLGCTNTAAEMEFI